MGDSLSWAADQEREKEQRDEEIAKKTPERLVRNIHRLAALADAALTIRAALGNGVPAADRELVDMMQDFSVDQIPGTLQALPHEAAAAWDELINKHNHIQQLLTGQGMAIEELLPHIKSRQAATSK